MEDWQERGINDLLREALKIYLRRDEEKNRKKAKIMVAVARESRVGREEPKGGAENKGKLGKWKKPPLDDVYCYYWGEKGHLKWSCKKLQIDEAIEREQNTLKKILRGDDD